MKYQNNKDLAEAQYYLKMLDDWGSDEGAEEYHKFLRTRDIHDVEVGGKLDVRRHIRKYA